MVWGMQAHKNSSVVSTTRHRQEYRMESYSCMAPTHRIPRGPLADLKVLKFGETKIISTHIVMNTQGNNNFVVSLCVWVGL